MDGGLFRLPEDGWYNIAIAGDFPVPDPKEPEAVLVQVLDEEGMRSMAGEIHGFAADSSWPGLLVDFDHQSLDTEKPSTAAGWIVDAEYRPTGLWAKIRWTSKGREALEGGTFRFISPVWAVADCEELGDKRLRPRHLMNCAVTNVPNIRGMVPLSNREAGRERLTVPARPLGLSAAPRRRPAPSWCGLANRRRLLAGLGVLANAIETEKQRAWWWAQRAQRTGHGGGNVAYDLDPNVAASNAAASVTGQTSGAEDLSSYYSTDQLAAVGDRYELGLSYDGRTGKYRLSTAAQIQSLENQRDALEKLKLDEPMRFQKRRITKQEVRREAMKRGLDFIEEWNVAQENNAMYRQYQREKFQAKKTYKGKAGLDAALNRIEKAWDEKYVKEARFSAQHNNRLNIRIADINDRISKLAHEERSRVEKSLRTEDERKEKAEAKAQKEAERRQKDAERRERASERAAKRAEDERKAAEARQAAAQSEAEAQAAKAAARAKTAEERRAAREAEREARARASAEKKERSDFLKRLSASSDFKGMSREDRETVFQTVNNATPEQLAVIKKNFEPILNRRDLVAEVVSNASHMTDEQRKAFFAKMGGGGGGSSGGERTPIYHFASPNAGGGGGGGNKQPLTVQRVAPTTALVSVEDGEVYMTPQLRSAYAALGATPGGGGGGNTTALVARPVASDPMGGAQAQPLQFSQTLGGALARLGMSDLEKSIWGDQLPQTSPWQESFLNSLRNRGVLANAGGAMSEQQRKAMFARLRGGGGGGGGSKPHSSTWDTVKAAASGFLEGAREGAENAVNALSFGLTDKFGVTHSYENTGIANEISKGLATIGALAAYSGMGLAAMGGAGIGLGAAAGLDVGGISAAEGAAALAEYDEGQVWNALDYLSQNTIGPSDSAWTDAYWEVWNSAVVDPVSGLKVIPSKFSQALERAFLH